MVFSRRKIATALAALVVIAATSAARVPRPATSGGPLVRSSVPRGWDAAMPRGGAYESGLAAAEEGRFRLAAQRFLDAVAEVRRLADGPLCVPGAGRRCDGKPTRATLRALVRKAAFAAEHARIAADAVSGDGARTETSADRHLQESGALRYLYLAARAFHGRDVPALRARAEAAYRAALATPEKQLAPGSPPSTIRARLLLGLASLLACAGDRRAADATVAQLRPSDLVAEVADATAAWRAIIGDADGAFEALATARDELPDWDDIAAILRISNDLDPLRDDPRFPRYLGGDD